MLSRDNRQFDATRREPPGRTTDRRIDQLVYQLYNLTPDEIRLVEETTA